MKCGRSRVHPPARRIVHTPFFLSMRLAWNSGTDHAVDVLCAPLSADCPLRFTLAGMPLFGSAELRSALGKWGSRRPGLAAVKQDAMDLRVRMGSWCGTRGWRRPTPPGPTSRWPLVSMGRRPGAARERDGRGRTGDRARQADPLRDRGRPHARGMPLRRLHALSKASLAELFQTSTVDHHAALEGPYEEGKIEVEENLDRILTGLSGGCARERSLGRPLEAWTLDEGSATRLRVAPGRRHHVNRPAHIYPFHSS